MDFTLLFGKIVNERLVRVILSAFLQKDSHHSKLAILTLVDDMQFSGKEFSIQRMFAGCMVVELDDIISNSIEFNVTARIIIDLSRMSIIQDVDFTGLVMKRNVCQVCFGRIGNVNRGLAFAYTTGGIRFIELPPLFWPFFALIRPVWRTLFMRTLLIRWRTGFNDD